MMIVQRTIACDGPGCDMQIDGTIGESAQRVRLAAKQDGWRRIARSDLCPSCSSSTQSESETDET